MVRYAAARYLRYAPAPHTSSMARNWLVAAVVGRTTLALALFVSCGNVCCRRTSLVWRGTVLAGAAARETRPRRRCEHQPGGRSSPRARRRRYAAVPVVDVPAL